MDKDASKTLAELKNGLAALKRDGAVNVISAGGSGMATGAAGGGGGAAGTPAAAIDAFVVKFAELEGAALDGRLPAAWQASVAWTLYDRIVDSIGPDGSWPGGDLVEIVDSWLKERGVVTDYKPEPDTQPLRRYVQRIANQPVGKNPVLDEFIWRARWTCDQVRITYLTPGPADRAGDPPW